MNHLITNDQPPYVDFAVFGPHGYRMQRRLKLSGMQICAGGELRHVELAGPPTFHLWEKCYKVLKTVLIMLGAVCSSRLDAYFEHIKQYHERYGPAVWHLLYQGDVRCRQERMIHLDRLASQEQSVAVQASGTHPYNPKKPWDHVWKMAVDDHYWWRKVLEEPCLLIVARTTSLNSMVDGDVMIAEAETPPGKRHRKTPGDNGGWTHTSAIGNSNFNLSPKKSNLERHHNVSNGTYSTNRRGDPICSGFQDGSCKEMDTNRKCAKDGKSVHQCNRCLGTDHIGSECTKTPAVGAQPSWVRFSGKGKSKGKYGSPKGGGKGKKGMDYYG